MEVLESSEQEAKKSSIGEKPTDLDKIMDEYLQQILQKLEISFQKLFPHLILNKLEEWNEWMNEAEESALEIVRPKFTQLPHPIPESFFKESFDKAKSGAEESAARKFRSLVEKLFEMNMESLKERIGMSEHRFWKEMSSVEKAFTEESSHLKTEPELELTSVISELNESFLLKVSDGYEELLQTVEGSSQELALKTDQAGQEIIQEFKELAPDSDDLHQFYEQQREKLSRIHKTALQQAHFNSELEQVLGEVITERRVDEERKRTELNLYIDELVQTFKTALENLCRYHGPCSRGEIEELKNMNLNKLWLETKKQKLDPTNHLQHLLDKMEECCQENRKRIEASGMMEEILDVYRKEILSGFKPRKYLSQTTLSKFHVQAKKKALKALTKREKNAEGWSKCSQELIIDELDIAFEEFKNRNAMEAPAGSVAVGFDSFHRLGGFYHGKKRGEDVKESQEELNPGLKEFVVLEKNYPERDFVEFLKDLKEQAESFSKQKQEFIPAVPTVPVYLRNDKNHEANVKEVMHVAGFEVLKILTEPEAAVMAQNLHWKHVLEPLKGLVYHLGRTGFNATAFTAGKGNVSILNFEHESNLGGVALIHEMVAHCTREFVLTTGIDLMAVEQYEDPERKETYHEIMMKLRDSCEFELNKMIFSDAESAVVAVQGITDGVDLRVEMPRDQFEQLISIHISQSFQIVNKVLERSKMRIDDLEEVVLTGHYTKARIVQDMVRGFFGKDVNCRIDPTQAVLLGAAVEAAVLNGKKFQERKKKSESWAWIRKRFKKASN